MKNFQYFFFTIILFSCSYDYRTEVERITKLNLGNSFNIVKTESLDAIGEGGFNLEFQIEDQTELPDLTTKIQSFTNFYPIYPERTEEREFWYKKDELYIMEIKRHNTIVSFILNSKTGMGKYSYFED